MKEKKPETAYSKYSKQRSKKSNLFLDCIKSFLFGGLICTIGQGLYNLYSYLGISDGSLNTLTSCTLIFIAALLTGIGVFDKIAKHAGAGTLVPITGFANAVVSPAIDNKAEGWILGLGAKMFIIAGPVIVYGTLASVIYGVIYWIIQLL